MKTPAFVGHLEPIARTKSSIVEVFQDFVRMSACALAAGTREPDYLEIAKKYKKDDLATISHGFGELITEMQNQPFHDVLGEYYQEINSKVAREQRGEFYTPPSISEMMVKMTMNVEEVIEKGLPITVSDPSCGSGSMLLKVAKEFQPKEKGEPSHVDLLRVTAQDISPVACDMAYINLTAWGVPAKVIHGNTLSMEIWNEWKNIHWFRVGEDTREKIAQLKAFMSKPSPEAAKKPDESLQGFVDSSDIRQKESEGGQFEFDL